MLRTLTSFLIAAAGAACAQDYPSQPIRLIGSSPGGGSDTVMRLIAPTLRAAFGQPAPDRAVWMRWLR